MERTAVIDYLTALDPNELVALLGEVFAGPPSDDDEPDDERAAVRRVFKSGR